MKIVDFALNMINYNKILAKIAKNAAKYTIFSSKNIKTNKKKTLNDNSIKKP